MTPTERQNAALATFVECVVAKLNPSLSAHTQPANGAAEYDVVIGGQGRGVLHEDLATVLRIATDHGGRAFVSFEGDSDRPLSIVWPLPKRAPGPDPEGDAEQQVKAGRRKPLGPGGQDKRTAS